MDLVIVALLSLLVGGVAALKVVAPKTKTHVDDDVLKFLDKYQVPIEEFLKLLQKK